jgi:MFS family permease
VIDLSMLRVRSFALANTAGLLFTASFSVMLLSNVLFMTGVWHDSVLRAGLQLAPGPLMAALLAVPSGRLAGRFGQHLLAGAGCLLFVLGACWWLWRVDASANWAGAMLPGLMIGGAGVGMVLPSLASAAAASLPPGRFATGSAVLTMSRQIGSVLGVAILVAILGDGSAVDPVGPFEDGWLFLIASGALAALAGFAIGPVHHHQPSSQSPEVPARAQLRPEPSRTRRS